MTKNRCTVNVLAALTNLFLAWRRLLTTLEKGVDIYPELPPTSP
jgi:hypothetical protein